MSLARSTLPDTQYCLPPFVSCLLDFLFLFIVCHEAALDRNFRRMVSIEKRCVNLHTSDFSRCNAELDHDPVGGLGVVATCFPAIVPGAGVYEVARPTDGRCGCEEVGG